MVASDPKGPDFVPSPSMSTGEPTCSDNRQSRLLRAARLHAAADKTDDAQDHDELHAAGDVVLNRTDKVSHYVKRWVEQLEERWVL